MKDEKYTFWFSRKHAEHFALMNETAYGAFLLDGYMVDNVCRKNFFVRGGQKIPYTTCTTRPDATEPFEGALKTFPDYAKVAEGTIHNIRTEGIW